MFKFSSLRFRRIIIFNSHARYQPCDSISQFCFMIIWLYLVNNVYISLKIQMNQTWRNMWKIWKNNPYCVDSGTWKNSEISPSIALGLWNIRSFPSLFKLWDFPLYSLWDLEKFRAFPSCIGSGTWRNSELPPYIDCGTYKNSESFPLYLNSG